MTSEIPLEQSPLSRLTGFINKNERKLSFLALLLGFIIDNFTLRRVDLYLENLVLVAYVFLVGLCIIVINFGDERLVSRNWWTKTKPFFVLAMQFALGSLWSAFLIFYSRSATLSASWPFLLILIGQLIANEFLRKQYARLWVQVSVFYIVLFSYLIFLVPVVLKQVSDNTFLFSGLLSLLFIWLFVKILGFLLPMRISEGRRAIIASIGTIFFFLNILYFTNNIPPIPLSLKQSGIFHTIERENDGGYVVSYEKQGWREFLQSDRTVHINPSDKLYAFNAVFAPSRLATTIIHRWERFDGTFWQTSSRIELPIIGGRDFGFRTFSEKSSLEEGLWRVSVETEDGRIIGRMKFNLSYSSTTPALTFDRR